MTGRNTATSALCLPLIPRPEKLLAPESCQSDVIPTMEELGLTTRQLIDRPIPGEAAAINTLKSFLEREAEAIEKVCLAQLLVR